MTQELALHLFSEMLKTGALVCLPLLGVTLLTGILVSVLQVVTQIQDASLSFIPKLVVFVVACLLLSPWILNKLTAFANAALAQASNIR